jgi:hypothetical protein
MRRPARRSRSSFRRKNQLRGGSTLGASAQSRTVGGRHPHALDKANHADGMREVLSAQFGGILDGNLMETTGRNGSKADTPRMAPARPIRRDRSFDLVTGVDRFRSGEDDPPEQRTRSLVADGRLRPRVEQAASARMRLRVRP